MSIETWLVESLSARVARAPSSIDREERFKSLGLSSLELTTMLAELGAKLGRPLAPTLAWEYPTIAALARHLDAASSSAQPSGLGSKQVIEPVAIVGLACRFPGAPDPDAYWTLLRDGVDAISEVPVERWDLAHLYDADPSTPGTMSTRWAGLLPHVDRFDPAFFGIAPREAIQIDPQQRLALELSWEALEDAGLVPASLRDSRTGVFFGAMWMDYARQLEGAREGIAQHTATGQDLSIVSARVSYTLGVMGPSLTVNTACSSSLVALHLASQSVLSGESRLAIAGGVNLLIAPESTVAMTKFGAMSPDGRCKAFDSRANGYVRGEGGGVVVLKRLSDARKDGDRVYCVIRGSAVNNDGFSNGLTAPSPMAQRAVLADALSRAGVGASEVQYVEAHGTGTMLGDPIEVGSLGAVYGAQRSDDRPLRVGSVKTNFGHLEAAAGMAGLIKVALAMKHRVLPASLHFQRPNPHIPFEALRVRVQTTLEPWRDEGGRLLAGVSSFGFGGTNSHAILEGEVPVEAPRLFVLSAPTEAGLRERAAELAAGLLGSAAPSLAALCETCAAAPREAHRLATVVRTAGELTSQLRAFSEGQRPRGVRIGQASAQPRVALLFTGQGSQYVGMARALASTQPTFRAALDRVVARLDRALGRSLLEVMWGDPGASLLDRTAYTQPALFAIEVALAELWRSLGVEPAVVMGHSVGEIAAAHVAGVLELDEAVALVVARARLMDSLPPGGAMVAIAASEARVGPRLVSVADRVSLASVNGASSVVIAGEEAAVLSVAAELEAEGVKTRRLVVSHAFHSPLMAPMQGAFRAELAALAPRVPRVPLVSNLGGRVVAEALGVEHWVRHVREPVSYSRGLAAVQAEVLLEVGPHPVLVELAEAAGRTGIGSLERGADDRATFLEAMGQLFVAGVPVRLGEASPRPVVLVTSGRTAAAARAQAEALAAHLEVHPELRPDAVALSAALTRSAHEHRVAVVGRGGAELSAALRAAPVIAVPRVRGSVAFVFSGQGSQTPGMGRALAAEWPAFRDALDDVLARFSGAGLGELREVMWSDDGRLGRTGYAQPAIFALEWALAALWRSWGVEPALVAGHSIGEVVAACVAGVMSLDDAVRLVAARARLMDALPGRGAMVSLAATEADVARLIEGTGVELAAINAPEQVVVTGPEEAVARVGAQAGVRSRPLQVSHAFHSAQLDPMLGAFADELRTIAFLPPRIPLASNVSGALAGAEVASAGYWVQQVRGTVRFAEGMRALASAGAGTFVELGPRAVLSSAVAATLPEAVVIPSLDGARSESDAMLKAAGALWSHGSAVSWPGVFPFGGERVALPTYAFQRERFWIERTDGLRGEPTDHPLLGVRVPVAGTVAVFETTLGVRRQPWLADHRVGGQIVFPAAAYAELARAAAARLEPGARSVRGLVIQAPLVLTAEREVTVQVMVDGDELSVHHQTPAGGWELHASARLEPLGASQGGQVDLEAVRARCQEVSVDELYSQLDAAGLSYGPHFRGLVRVWRGGAETLAELSGGEGWEGGFSPMLLDAAIQAAVLTRDEAGLALPFEVGAFAGLGGGVPRWAQVRAEGPEASIVLTDDEGRVCATLEGVRFRRVSSGRVAKDDAFYRLDWPASEASAKPTRAAGRAVLGAPAGWAAALGAEPVTLAGLSTAAAGELVCVFERRDGDSVVAASHRLAAEGLAIVQALRARAAPVSLRWVTRGAIGPTGTPLEDPAAAVLWGLGRTVMHEHPELSLRLIDTDDVASLARELEVGDDESQVLWRGGQRRVARLARAEVAPGSSPLELRGTVVITGGLGALGLAVAQQLADEGVPHLVLTGRRGRQTPGIAEALAQLEARTRVTIEAVDLSDRQAVAALLARIPEAYPLRGVVHAAGVVDDGLLSALDPARLAAVLAPKVDGAWNLHELTAGVPLDFFVLFSSVSGLLGAAGQGNYAAANTALDALAAHRRASGLVATSLAWGPWAEAGMAARLSSALQGRLERQGLKAWPIAEALGQFRAALERSESCLGVLKLDLAAAARGFEGQIPPVWRSLVKRSSPARSFAPVRGGEPWPVVVAAAVAQVLSLKGDVPTRQPLSELGLDSLMAVELRNVLAKRVGHSLPATLAFDHPTVDALAVYLESVVSPAVREVPRSAAPSSSDDRIAIVGMGCRYPGGIVDAQSYWKVLSEGLDAVGEMPGRWDTDALFDPDPEAVGKMTTRSGGFVADIDQFDATFFGISPREAAMMDPQQRLLLETTWEALEQGGLVPETLVGSDTGVFVGLMYQEYASLGGGLPALDGYGITGSLGSVASGRLSYVLGLKGPSLTVDTACSSSLVTLHLACQALRRGECSLALAGGVALMLTPSVFVEFSRLRGLASDGRCKSFGAGADGVGWAEGCGMLVLKRLKDAERDGDRVLAVVRGTAVNQDGRSNGLTAPNGPSQQAVIEAALADAGLEAKDVDYVECHGTGTKLGDPIEAQALGAAMGERSEPVLMGSVKSNLGHTQAAAGAAGVMKVVLALEHETLPKSLHAEEKSPHVEWGELPVKVVTEAVPWKRSERPRRAGVSSFGISGTNAHVILEEAPRRPEPPRTEAQAPYLFTLSGKSEAAVRAQAARLAQSAEASSEVAFTLATARSQFDHRAAIVASSTGELRAALQAAAAGEPIGARGQVSGRSKVVFVFPGQGSQWLGMGRRLVAEEPTFRAAFTECDRAIREEAGWSALAELSADEAASQLQRIDVVQPMLFAFEVALAAQWRAWGLEPDAVVGHSMGEVAAAHVAGILTLKDAVAVICRRSALLRRISGRGEMALVELGLADAEAEVHARRDRVSVAVSNGPRSTVLAGDPVALGEILAALEARGVFCRRIKVEVASHSPQVDELRGELLSALASLEPRQATIPMWSTVRNRQLEGPECQAAYWVENLRQPVRFGEAISEHLRSGRGTFVELSPHPILTVAIEENRAATPSGGVTVGSLRRGLDDRLCLLESAGALWASGHSIALERVVAAARKVTLPTYAWQHQRHWLAAAAAPRAHAGHPLLGEGRDVSTHRGTRLWESTLELERLPYLADHRVQGAVVFPAAASLEAALAIGAATLEAGAFTVNELVLDEALVIAGPVALQAAVSSDGPGDLQFQLASRAGSSWLVHAKGKLRAAPKGAPAPVGLELEALQTRLGPSIDGATAYARLASRGLEYGPAFRGIGEVWSGAGEALARVRLPATAGSASTYQVHPALLDACMQTSLSVVDEGGEGSAPWVPVQLAQASMQKRPPSEVWCHVRRGEVSGERCSVDLTVADASGAVVLELRGLVLQQLAGKARETAQDDRYLELDWQSAPVPSATVSKGRWLLIGGAEFAGRLAEALTAAGHQARCVDRLEGAAFDAEPPSAVVHLASLSISAQTPVEEALVAGCDSVLQTVQAIAKQGWRDLPRLWLVTRGAQAPSAQVLQAPLLGLGRVISLEHAALRCGRVDLDPAGPEGELEQLLAELLGDDAEEEVRLRGGSRAVARLVRRVPEEGGGERLEPSAGRPYRLDVEVPGTLEGLRLRAAERVAPGPGEVEIAVEAAGLNFLDVLLALGVMPNDVAGGGALRLGSECAGRVVAVGAGVDLSVGEAVVAVTPRGAFASHLTLPAALVLPCPAGLSMAEAASLPVAYLTAWYALDRIGRLRRGDRVLIHSATGGVGLAAVQWAQHVGAEIYATAGSEEKREYLRNLGIRYVSDSRSERFVTDVKTWTRGEGVDVVLNSLSGELLTASFGLLRSHGRFVELGKRDYYADHQLGLRPFLRNLSFSLVDLRGMMIERPEMVRELFFEFLALVQQGVFRAPPLTVRPIGEIADAFHAMSRGQHVGKAVMVFDREPSIVAPARAVTIRADGAYLVTGGLGGLGLGIARWLAEQGAGHLVLVGRSGATSAEQEQAIAAMRSLGARVTVAAADVSRREDVSRLVAQHGAELRGVVHAAGLLDDGLVLQQTPAKVRAVMAPKLLGALHLHELTRDLPIELFVLYSSSAGVLGSPGQANYAAANTALDALAHHRRSLGLHALSIDWGAFSEVGLAAASDNRAARLEARGMQSLAPADGPVAVARLLAADRTQACVVPLDARQWVEFYPAAASSRMLAPLVGAARARSAQELALQEQLSAASGEERARLLRDLVLAQVRRVLRLTSADPETPFTSLGMDSLTGLELRNRIEAVLGVRVPATLLWTYPTITALARHLGEMLFGVQAVEPAPAPEPQVAAPADEQQLLTFIDDLIGRANQGEAS